MYNIMNNNNKNVAKLTTTADCNNYMQEFITKRFLGITFFIIRPDVCSLLCLLVKYMFCLFVFVVVDLLLSSITILSFSWFIPCFTGTSVMLIQISTVGFKLI